MQLQAKIKKAFNYSENSLIQLHVMWHTFSNLFQTFFRPFSEHSFRENGKWSEGHSEFLRFFLDRALECNQHSPHIHIDEAEETEYSPLVENSEENTELSDPQLDCDDPCFEPPPIDDKIDEFNVSGIVNAEDVDADVFRILDNPATADVVDIDADDVDADVLRILDHPATEEVDHDLVARHGPDGKRIKGYARLTQPYKPRYVKKTKTAHVQKAKVNYSALHGRAPEGSTPVKAAFEFPNPAEADLPVACGLCPKRCRGGTHGIKQHDREDHGIIYKKLRGYHCRECVGKNQTTSFRGNMVKHAKWHHTHECHLCSAEVVTRFSLNRHLKEAHGEDMSLFCDFCEYYALTADVLRDHLRTQHCFEEDEPERKGHKCHLCTYSTQNREELASHVAEMHSSVVETVRNLLRPAKSEQSVKFHCGNCDFSAYGRYEIVAHVKDWHQEGQGQAAANGRVMPRVEVTCAECRASFHGQNALAEHMIAEHSFNPCSLCQMLRKEEHGDKVHDCFKRTMQDTGAVQYQCTLCSYRGTQLRASRQHFLRHVQEKTFKCDQCPMSFRIRSELTSHKKLTHTEVALFKCDICGMRMKRRVYLERHMQGHQKGRMFKCAHKTCGYESSNKFVISTHFIKEHITYDPEKVYMEKLMCDQCPFKTDLKVTLKRHREKFHQAKSQEEQTVMNTAL